MSFTAGRMRDHVNNSSTEPNLGGYNRPLKTWGLFDSYAITERYFYGPEAKDEFVFYDATEKKTECTGNLREQAEKKNKH